MQFAAIPGLPETKEHLLNAVKNNHLAHALLFHGQEGSATLTMALALSTYVFCQNPSETDSCGKCSSCQRMSRLVLPDMNFALPSIPITASESEEEKKTDLLKNWREFAIQQPYGNVQDYIYLNDFHKKQLNISRSAARRITETLSLKSFEGGYKVMLIWAPEYLHQTAANALLKIIEEPQPKTLFLLVTSRPEQLLTTILSRTQQVRIRPFTDEEIKSHFIETGITSEEEATQLAMLSDGNMREAYRLADQVEDLQVKRIREWFLLCYKADFKAIFSLADQFHKSDKEAQKSFILTGLNVLREILLKNIDLDKLLRTHNEDRGFVNKISKNVLKEEHVADLYEAFNQAHYHLERNGSAKFIFTDLSMNIALLMAKVN